MTTITPEESPSKERFLCRMGTVFLIAAERKKFDTYADELRDALQNDPRVQWVKRPNLNTDFCAHAAVYPDSHGSSDDEVMRGSDALRAANFDSPFIFKVVVPIKNQPQHHHADDIPTDTYWVAWDGVSLLVLWSHQSELIPLSGGQVILQILQEVTESIGMGVYNQSCSPSCTNVFMHANLVIQQVDREDVFLLKAVERLVVNVYVSEVYDSEDLLLTLYYRFHQAIFHFSRQKNLGRRIIDLEAAAWTRASHLLSHYAAHVDASATPAKKRIKMRWQNRGWRREVRSLSAQTWVCMTGIEVMLRRWRGAQNDFLGEAAEQDSMPVFLVDYQDEVKVIEHIDLSRLENISGQVESRLDNRLVSLATAGGAISGGITGALVSLIGG
ncbi:hypothetical protein [Streptomyces sp. BPSDS2]|uniref:hypothetical protein n=1 Tax=Streptomyces sp. BPSDS2 TaxID=2571021 RepID=UPI0010C19900|nr:hypothetical protein [Streptomyces sp. BPSDS2]